MRIVRVIIHAHLIPSLVIQTPQTFIWIPQQRLFTPPYYLLPVPPAQPTSILFTYTNTQTGAFLSKGSCSLWESGPRLSEETAFYIYVRWMPPLTAISRIVEKWFQPLYEYETVRTRGFSQWLSSNEYLCCPELSSESWRFESSLDPWLFQCSI